MNRKELNKKDIIRKKDIYLILGIALAACVGLLLVQLAQKKPGTTVLIKVDGEQIAEYALAEEQDFTVQNGYGFNRIVISKGMVSVTEADCPDRYCVQHRAVSEANQSIVCLPHKLVVEIAGDENRISLDGISE